MQATEARLLGGDNPHRVKNLVKTLDDSLSGVVQGEHASVMEIYGGHLLCSLQRVFRRPT